MKYDMLHQADQYTKAHQRKKRWHKVVTCLAAVVVFCTTYALILPAITMEEAPICGLEEHTHTEDCYRTEIIYPQSSMNCSIETLGVHEHTAACFDEEGNLICGYADFVVHTHDENCYSEDGTLICTLPEIEEHTHSEACYAEERTLVCEEEEDTGHIHDDTCYETEQVLICGKEEIQLHTHDDSCYDEAGNLICGKLETLAHQHTEDCIVQSAPEEVRVLICELPEHTHTKDCFPKTESEEPEAKESENVGDVPDEGSDVLDSDDSTEENSDMDDEQNEGLIDGIAEEIPLAVFSMIAEPTGNETLSIHVEKQWVGDAAYMRPESITVKLLCNDAESGKLLTLSADNNWSGAFTGNFPKYDESGTEIKYTVSEDAVSDYELVSNDYTDTASPVDLNSLELWVPVTKLEAGEDYLAVSGLSGKQSLYRAESTVTDGVLSASVTVNEGSASDLNGNAYKNYILLNTGDETGQSLYLSWKAVAADGGMNLQSNVYTAWNGKTKYLLSQDGKWKVTDDGTQAAAIFVPDDNGGFHAGESGTSLYFFKQVPLDISSLPASSYTRNYTLVNRYEPADIPPTDLPQATTTSVNVTKQWADEADHSGDSVTVWLLRDGERTEQSAVLNAGNDWTYCFDNLPIYRENGSKYVYDVQEEDSSIYRAEYHYDTTSTLADAVWLPTNCFEDGVTYLIVTSADTGDVIGMEALDKGFAWTSVARAGTIYVSSSDAYPRYITDEEAQKHTAMQWIAEDKGIQEAEQVGTRHVYALKNVQYGSYAKNNGQGDLSSDCTDKATWWYYGYTRIDEVGNEAKRYPKRTPESDWSYVLGSMNDYFLLDNNHTGDGESQEAQTFYLYRRYEIQEPQLNVTITNHPIAETSLSVLKDWVNDDSSARPGSITIRLLANGEDTGKILILTDEMGWQGSFDGLPTTDMSSKAIEYTVVEDPVAGYISSYFYSTEDGVNKVVITNRTQPVLPETGGSGTTPYTIGGLLLITAAGFLLLYKYIKRRKEDFISS